MKYQASLPPLSFVNWKPYKIKKQIRCPICKQYPTVTVTAHNPSGVSHGEVHTCSLCNEEIFIVIYYDSAIYAQVPNYVCANKVVYTSFKDISKNHKQDNTGLWNCIDEKLCIAVKVANAL